jgi:death-on-curing family protein
MVAVRVSGIVDCSNLRLLNHRQRLAAYLYHLVMNHPFVDGNKRVGLEAALIFLEINDSGVDASDDELVNLVLETTSGEANKREIADFFRSHQVAADGSQS